MIFLPASLDAAGRLVEGDQHVPVAAAGGVAGPHLHEKLDSALGDIQVSGAQVGALAHGRRRVDEEEQDGHLAPAARTDRPTDGPPCTLR